MLHQIGIGTLGPVFRTYEPSRDRLVAVKVFRLDIVPEQSKALADALERAVQASLFHPSIVEPIGAGVEGTVAYRAEEYVAAESLDVAMRHYAPAPIDKVLPFITQLAGAIDFARAAGIGHGALHPRDIFVTPDEARATGFGVIDALEQIGVRAPVRRPYTAPERIEGRPWGTGADIFSLAAITFELLTGRRPAGTGAQIGTLPDGEQSPAMHAVLARAMDDDPARRYGSALAFAAALESASRGEPESATMSDVAAIAAAAPPSAAAAAPAPLSRETAAIAPAAARPAATPPVVPTPGEFEIERRLTPASSPHSEVPAEPERSPEPAVAPASKAVEPPAAPATPTLFESEAPEQPAAALHAELPPFADEFVADEEPLELAQEQTAAGEDRRPFEPFETEPAPEEDIIQPQEPPYAGERAELPHDVAFEGHESSLDHVEYGHSSVLPVTLGCLLCLLIGFGLGYFVRGHNQPAPESQTAAATPAPMPPDARTDGAQAVSQPAAPAAGAIGTTPAQTPPAEPPPAVSETPLGSESARAATPPDAHPTPRTEPREPARAGRAAGTGHLVVRSTPEHAGVTVNGTWRGRTPLTLDDLPLGHYVVRIVEPGYHVERQEFSLTAADAAHTFSARLEKLEAAAHEPAAAPEPARPAAASVAFTGTLYVDSRPQGATVLLDGRSIGRTPLTLPDVTIGMHVVRIDMTGKKPWSSTARIVAGETVRVTASLEDK